MIFLDESGDAGFKFAQGSSSHFVIALVIFDSPLDAEETALAIKRLRQTLRLHETFEFKFNKMSDFYRFQFLEAVRASPFRVRAMVVDKRALRSEHLTNNKESFYNYFVSEVLRHNHGKIQGASLRVDGSGDRAFQQAFKTYLRSKLPEQTVKKCKMVDSKKDSLIQLADMMAGSLCRKYNPQKADAAFVERVRHKIEDCWEFDKKNWPAS